MLTFGTQEKIQSWVKKSVQKSKTTALNMIGNHGISLANGLCQKIFKHLRDQCSVI